MIFAMTLFAVVVVHEFIYEQSCPLDLIVVQGTPIDTDQPQIHYNGKLLALRHENPSPTIGSFRRLS